MSGLRISTGFMLSVALLNPNVAFAQLVGDFNEDGLLNAADLDLQAVAIITSLDPVFDLNNDGFIDFEDREVWVHELKDTWFGDANLDLEFTSSDLVQVFQRGKYETQEQAGWEEGDWNGDLVFDSSDMVAAFIECAYEVCNCGGHNCPKTEPAPVPEPSGWLLLLLASICLPKFRAVSNAHFDE